MQGMLRWIGCGGPGGKRKLPALVLALVLAGPALVAQGATAPSSVDAKGAPLAAFDFSRHTDARFSEDREAGIDALVAAHDLAGLEDARMRLATLYLAHLMLPEARSLLDAVKPARLDPAARARRGALAAATRIMSGQALDKDMPDSPLTKAHAGWADYHFWVALNAIRAKDKAGIKANLPGALERLGAYPRVYHETCLPLFFAAALDIGDWTLAKRVAQRFDAYPDLVARPVYSYLLGRAALGVHRVDSAREAFGKAAQGRGPYAQRALLALVDLGLAERSLSPDKAHVLLMGSLAAWQGGEIELEALRRLVHVDRMRGDWPGMLLALGRILRDFPDSEDARPAANQADGLIEAYYQYGMQGKVSLSRLLTLHRKLVPLFRFDASFEATSQRLADHLLALGATAMAAQEYARIHDTLLLAQQAGKGQADPARLAALKLGEAEALAAGGRYDAAATALAAAGAIPADLKGRASALRMRLDAARGEMGAVAKTEVADPTAEDLRLQAAASAASGDWEVARRRYKELWSAHPKAFGSADAINLLLAAARLGDLKTADAVRAAFPDLDGAPAWAPLADTLLAPAPKLAPLSRKAATTQLDGAQKVISGVDAALRASPQEDKN